MPLILKQRKSLSYNSLLANFTNSKFWKLIFFILAIVILLSISSSLIVNKAFAFTDESLKSSSVVKTDSVGKYIQVGDKRYDVVDIGGRDTVKETNHTVGGGAFDLWARERLATQDRGGDNSLKAVANQTKKAVADSAVSTVGGYVLDAVIAVLSYIARFLAFFVSLAAQLLEGMLDPGMYNLTTQPAINKGWTIIRDICNLLFLLILLFISFCTILQIDKYHIKKTLLTLVIMALLINFSKPIAIFIFDGSQLMMNYFLKLLASGSTGATTKLANLSQIDKLIFNQSTIGTGPDKGAIVVKYLFVIIFLFMFLVALLVISIFLIIRLVAIWIIVMVSPIGFFANILPDFKGMSTKWWDALFKYSYFGPAMAFFLYMAIQIQSQAMNMKTFTLSLDNVSATISSLFPFVVTLVFLYMAITVSQHFSIQFASAVTSRANKVLNSAAKAGAMGALTVGTLGGYQWGRDAYQGTREGVSQRPGWRMLTKKGREAYKKERQGKWEDRFAPANLATVRKRSKELENKNDDDIIRMAQRGDLAAAHVASSRGILDDQIIKSILPKLRENPAMRNEIISNARKNKQAHMALNIRMETSDMETTTALRGNRAAIALNEVGREAPSQLVKNQNIGKLADVPEALAALTTVFGDITTRATTGTPQQRRAAQQQLNNISTNASYENEGALRLHGLI